MICLAAAALMFTLTFYAIEKDHPILAFFLAYLAVDLIYHALGLQSHTHGS